MTTLTLESLTIDELVRGWNGEAVVVRHDRETDAWLFITVHDTTLGPGLGGCRLRVYPTPADGLRDAMKLAEGMTYKWAAVGMRFGGAKLVIAARRIPVGAERVELFRRVGRLVETLRGAFGTGGDLGTTPDDIRVIGEETAHVVGADPARFFADDPGPFTARGVELGIRAALAHACGDEQLAGKTILIQGLGDVGAPLARSLAAAGADVVLTDVNAERLATLSSELDVRTLPPGGAHLESCDVFAPCAVGGVLNVESIPALGCRIVAGAANNQLATPADADRLHERGILYVPDYIINAGGAIAFGSMLEGATDPTEIWERVDGIGGTAAGLLAEAARHHESPVHTATRRVRRALDRGRRGVAD